MAIVNVAMHDALCVVDTRCKPVVARIDHAPGGSPAAAAAAAAHTVLVRAAPSQKETLDQALATSLAAIADEQARAAGLAAGTASGTAVWQDRLDDALTAPDDYRPFTTPGVWVPTTPPISPEYARAKLWGQASNSHYRPGPPPALDGAQWARDYNETRALGGRASTVRTPAQTEAVKFWSQAALGSAGEQVARQVVEARKPTLLDTARFYAHLNMSLANTFMADWDAKFHYNFWRPVTAIRNGDRDGNDATEREATWTPLNATPMHPEYPSQAGMSGAVIRGVVERHFGADAGPFTIVDPADPKQVRTFANVAAMTQETSEVRIWGGVHFRTSLEVSAQMGRRIVNDLAPLVGSR
jgi:hypothetical protein